MGIVFIILAVLIFACLIVGAAMQPAKPLYTASELKRRAHHSKIAAADAELLAVYPELTTFFRGVRAALFVLLVAFLIGVWGWLGVVIALIAGVLYPVISRIGGIQRGGRDLYERSEPWLIACAHKYKKLLHAFREPANIPHDKPLKVHSREELSELIDHSRELLSEHERLFITSALTFSDRTVETVMTPRDDIQTVKHTEFLGPLVLDELHGFGHSYLPVITEDIDNVVGVLHLEGLLSLDIKRSATAEKAMERRVEYIQPDVSLERALALFLQTKQHLLIVRSETHETVGLVTLADVIGALVGRHVEQGGDA